MTMLSSNKTTQGNDVLQVDEHALQIAFDLFFERFMPEEKSSDLIDNKINAND